MITVKRLLSKETSCVMGNHRLDILEDGRRIFYFKGRFVCSIDKCGKIEFNSDTGDTYFNRAKRAYEHYTEAK